MKKLLILFTLLILNISSYSQIFITLNPMQGHFNPGIVVNLEATKTFGFYGNVLYGDVKYTDQYGDQFKANQLKYGAGISYKTLPDVSVLLGFSTSKFDVISTNSNVDLDYYVYPAINIGFFAELPTKRKMRVLFLTDVNNWESQIGINIKLKKH